MTLSMVNIKVNKIKIDKFYVNKRNGQYTLVIPKKKMKEDIAGKKIVVSYW